LASALSCQLLGSLPAHLAFVREQAQRGEGTRQLAAHTVVDADRLGRRRAGLISVWLAASITRSPSTITRRSPASASESSASALRTGSASSGARLRQRGDRGDLGVGVFGREWLEQRRVNRRQAGRAQQPSAKQ
jgi:hypothetical protein